VTATAKGAACRDLYQTLEDLGYFLGQGLPRAPAPRRRQHP
jgi:hypothetical protein